MLSSTHKNKIRKRKGWKCEHCGIPVDNTNSKLHHLVPKIKGGKDTFKNLKLLCRDCEKKEHKEHPERYMIPYEEYITWICNKQKNITIASGSPGSLKG